MKIKGQGFARLITKDNINKLSPLLQGAQKRGTHRGTIKVIAKKALKSAEDLFNGTSITLGREPKTYNKKPTTFVSRRISLPVKGSMWIYTGKMTGGSGNQLDLSKTGQPQKGTNTPYGSVSYFGINPHKTSIKKLIDIKFNNNTYKGNSVEYKMKNSNWRLLFKGKATSGAPLTTAPSNGFVNKILVFSKKSKIFELQILPISKMKQLIASSSKVWRGGKGGKGRVYGII